MKRYCRTCKAEFDADKDWMVDCIDCWRRRKRERENADKQRWQDREPESPVSLLERQIRRFALDLYEQARKVDERELELRYQAGRDEGYRAGFDDGAAGASGIDPGLLRDLVELCHPDRHSGRVEKATRATQRLLELLERKTTRRAA